MPEKVLRLFVSSPSDVAAERERVRIVAERLNGEFEGLARIEVRRWEDSFYTATASFQEAIDAALAGMSDTDIVICIVWKRAGLKLNPAIWHRQDGSAYESGTVLEFEAAVSANRTHGGVPDVYLFRKTEAVRFDEHAVDEQKEQRALLQAVLKRWTETPEGYNTAGSQSFADTDEFERDLEACLRQWLERKGIALKGPVWDRRLKGSPFRGLAAFDASHAPVFFGREAAIARATARLRAAPSFLLVLGVSGTGKSSLLRAGLLPRLARAGVIADVDLWRAALVEPAADPLASLAQALHADTALGAELRSGDFATPATLAQALAAGGEVALAPLRAALARAAKDRATALHYDAPRPAKLLLGIDQVERLFVEAKPEAVEAFAAIIKALVDAGLASVIAALRSDAYGRFQQVEAFLALREAGATLDLLPPGRSELEDMVTRPVAACEPPLAFETTAKGSLADTLVTDAKGGDALPLLQMTLQRLYEAEAERNDGVLRFADYPGIDAAVRATAEEAFEALDEAARTELPALITALVRNVETATLDGQQALTILPLARAAFEAKRPARTALIDAFITHRLLTAEETDGAVRVRPVHEALLRAWPQAVRIITEHAALIRVRHTLEPMAADWARAEKSAKAGYLVSSQALLAGAAQLPLRFGDDLGDDMRDFIAASLVADALRREAERRRSRRVLMATAAGLVGALVLAGLAVWQWRAAEEQKRIALEQTQIAKDQSARAERALNAATQTANGLVYRLAQDLRDREGVPVDVIRRILESAETLQRQLAESGEASPGLRLGQASALMELVDTFLAAGDTMAAQSAGERAAEIMEKLVAEDPADDDRQRELSVAYNKVGDALVAQGQRNEALVVYRKALAIREKLVAAQPTNVQAQRDLSISYDDIGDILVALGQGAEALEYYRKDLAITEKFALANPDSTAWQRDLSGSYERIGHAMEALGDNTQALDYYRKDLAIAEKLANAAPNNAALQFELSISYSKIADVLVKLDQRAQALDNYRKSLAIREKLVASDPGNATWQRRLSISYERVGDMLDAQGDGAQALLYYRKNLAIAEKLVVTDPADVGSQWKLFTSLWRLANRGDDARGRFTRALGILRKLDAEGKLTPDQKVWIARAEEQLAALPP